MRYKKNFFSLLPQSIIAVLAASCCLFPCQGVAFAPIIKVMSNSSSLELDAVTSELVKSAKKGDVPEIIQDLERLAILLDQSDHLMKDSHVFLENYIGQVNRQHGLCLTLDQVLNASKELVKHLSLSEEELEGYETGLELLEELHSFRNNPLCSYQFAKHRKKSKANVWSWLTVATVTAGAVTVCALCPTAIPGVLDGLMTITLKLISQKNKKTGLNI